MLLHAAPGVVGLVAGLLALPPPQPGARRRGWRVLYAVCVAMLVAGIVALIIQDWPTLDPAARVVFLGLLGLGLVMGVRLWLAHRLYATGVPRWQERYVGHVYFTYVSLWIGFLIVPALATPLPQVAVPLAVVVVLGVGHVLLTRYRRQRGWAQPRGRADGA